jgi:hypothetical protein
MAVSDARGRRSDGRPALDLLHAHCGAAHLAQLPGLILLDMKCR